MSETLQTPETAWSSLAAWLLVCATFPLIWIGGLVTTYDAGMAVPDWPSTYGYNLFLYPWQKWVAGPWDLFIEHGHRLFASFVGLLTILLVIATWHSESRRGIKWMAVGALAFVLAQGLLGGLRVLWDDRNLARIHGIVGPLFFAYVVLLAALLSPSWRRTKHELTQKRTNFDRLGTTAWFILALAFLQLVFGSQLRHVSGLSSGDLFGLALAMHVAGAVALLALTAILFVGVLRTDATKRLAPRATYLLTSCVLFQVLLGLGTWVSKYGMPIWLVQLIGWEGYTIQANSMQGAVTATAHVAIGALILATSGYLAAWDVRLATLQRPQYLETANSLNPGTAA